MTVHSPQNKDIDPVTLEVFRNKLESVAEEMGQVLIRSAYSPNIKERQDCSTALFDVEGRMVAQAEHIPVHLGAMPDAVAAVTESDLGPGDAYILNDPFEGGTHLPDVTIVSTLAPEGEVVGVRGDTRPPRRYRRHDSRKHACRRCRNLPRRDSPAWR
jgi:N-methylhydantoinase B/acetone carboxylase, alpha subunit